jgi:cell division protein FtsI/penicillin-binding protein 2
LGGDKVETFLSWNHAVDSPEDMASASIGQSVVQITPLQLPAPMRCSLMVDGS